MTDEGLFPEIEAATKAAQFGWEKYFAGKDIHCICGAHLYLGAQVNGLIHVIECAACHVRYFFHPLTGKAWSTHGEQATSNILGDTAP